MDTPPHSLSPLPSLASRITISSRRFGSWAPPIKSFGYAYFVREEGAQMIFLQGARNLKLGHCFLSVHSCFYTQRLWRSMAFYVHCWRVVKQESRAIAGRTARRHCKFRYVSNFTTASCGYSATSRLSCTGLHQRPFEC